MQVEEKIQQLDTEAIDAQLREIKTKLEGVQKLARGYYSTVEDIYMNSSDGSELEESAEAEKDDAEMFVDGIDNVVNELSDTLGYLSMVDGNFPATSVELDDTPADEQGD